MKTIYLIRTYGKDVTYYKVGYTSNFLLRLKAYITHNPSVEILGTIEVYAKTKHSVETAIHNEIEEMGYSFISRFGTVTEWFAVERDSKMDKALDEIGLKVFDTCKNRKYIKWTV